ncbi:cytochrome P450 [Paenarthrobacter sp. A20]|uniref:cytochrome P450 n=1 Tax=Paenarthrobacter sp. A20 TaxID=2817891 RepID=UPI0020A094C4|nr:cytochrome P450 [Paenarthrobacter sp. A20]MCP1413781.1 cytochrome P450 [Paenarthrobacter sp. A20]
MKEPLDFADPTLYQNPVPAFNKMREEHPVFWSDSAGSWVVSRHADVVMVLNNLEDAQASLFKINDYAEQCPFGKGTAISRGIENALVTTDLPDHPRLRRHTAPLLTRRSVERDYAETVEQTVIALLECIEEDTRFDVLDSISVPLPLAVVTKLIGFDAEDPLQLNHWAVDLTRSLEPHLDSDSLEASDKAATALEDYLQGVLRDHASTAPAGTVLQRLYQGMEEGTLLSEQEAVVRLIELVAAGTETTTTIIPAAFEAMTQFPQVWKELQADPSLIPAAAEEFLRFATPSPFTGRVAVKDISLGEHVIRPGDSIQLAILAANRDPRVFSDPDVLDIHRTPNPHITFGGGIHACLGQHLARLELITVLKHAVSRWESFEVATEQVVRRDRIGVWGYSAFPMTVQMRAA